MKTFIILLIVIFITACSNQELVGVEINKIDGLTSENITINGSNSFLVQRNISIDTRFIVDIATITIKGMP